MPDIKMSRKINISNNNPKFDIEENKYQKEFISFLENKICEFPNYFYQTVCVQDLQDSIEGENRITEQFHRFLTTKERSYTYTLISQEDIYHFVIENQTSGKGHRTYDIAIILGYDNYNKGKILVIEAKRLPTPGKDREKEYLLGNYGGIERFKKGVHGQDVESGTAIILGYIQQETDEIWYNKINDWIDGEITKSSNPSLKWDNEDKLICDGIFQKDKVKKYLSSHSRIHPLSKLRINHYWIDLSKK